MYILPSGEIAILLASSTPLPPKQISFFYFLKIRGNLSDESIRVPRKLIRSIREIGRSCRLKK